MLKNYAGEVEFCFYSKQATHSCIPSLWCDITVAGKAARLSEYEAHGGGVTQQHPPSDLARPPEAADIDCNNACAGLN